GYCAGGRVRDRLAQRSVLGGEPVSGKPRVKGGDVVLGDLHAGELLSFAGRSGGQRGGAGEGDVLLRTVGGGQLQVGDRHVVLGDELGLFQPQAGAGEHAVPVARSLLALLDLFGQRHGLAVDGHLHGVEGIDAELVPVGGRAAEADDGRVVGIHIGGAPTGEQPVVRVAISACVTVAGEHVIDPEVVLDVLAGTVGHICVEDSLQLVSGGGVHRQLRHGVLLT